MAVCASRYVEYSFVCVAVKKFRFCGGLEPPDWLLAEISLLSGERGNVAPRDLVVMCEAIGADIGVQDLDQAQALFDDADDAKVAVAALRFILTHAAKYDTKRADLVEELLQLGMPQTAADAIAQSYEHERAHIQDQQRAHRFQFPHVEAVEWKVTAPSSIQLNLKLDLPAQECGVQVAPSPSTRELRFSLSKSKFLALYEELSQAQTTLRGL